jgi:hypothetical protein
MQYIFGGGRSFKTFAILWGEISNYGYCLGEFLATIHNTIAI